MVTWGRAEYGGDSGTVQEQLRKVQQIQSNDGAFAAIVDGGSVVAWLSSLVLFRTSFVGVLWSL